MLIYVSASDRNIGDSAASNRCACDVEQHVTFFDFARSEQRMYLLRDEREVMEVQFSPPHVLAAKKRPAAVT